MAARTFTYYDADGNELSGPILDMQAWEWKKKMPEFDLPRRIKGTLGYVRGYLNGVATPVHRVVAFKNHNPSLHKCGARCRNAKGPNCECSCGGEFHGADS